MIKPSTLNAGCSSASGPHITTSVSRASDQGKTVGGVFDGKMDTDLDRVIDRQLSLQIEVSFDAHHAFLNTFGLGNCRRVLEFGSGNGLFTARLAKLHSTTEFIGMDMKQEMIDWAEANSRELSVDNVRWVKGDEKDLEKRIGRLDGILLRYTAMHMQNIAHALGDFRSVLNKGGTLWLIDTEIDELRCEPPNPAFEIYKSGMLHAFRACGVDPHIGSRLPGMLSEAGFDVVATEVDSTSNVDMGLDAYRNLVWGEIQIFKIVDDGAYTPNELAMIRAFLKEDIAKEGCIATMGTMMMAARK